MEVLNIESLSKRSHFLYDLEVFTSNSGTQLEVCECACEIFSLIVEQLHKASSKQLAIVFILGRMHFLPPHIVFGVFSLLVRC